MQLFYVEFRSEISCEIFNHCNFGNEMTKMIALRKDMKISNLFFHPWQVQWQLGSGDWNNKSLS